MSKRRTLKVYRSYNFVEKDPIIDATRTLFSDRHASYTDVSQDSGVAVSTIRNWFHGSTRRPQFATVAAVVKSLGARNIRFGKNGPILD